jgi:outer membrane protein assembly factor BamB
LGLSASGSVLAQSSLQTSTWPLFRHDPQLTGRADTNGPSTPQVNWVLELGAGQLGAPVVGANGTIFVSGEVDNNVYAIDAAGNLKWRFASSSPFLASPVVGNNGSIYLGDVSGVFYAIKPDGRESWKIRLGGGVRFSANIGNAGTIFVVADDGMLYCITLDGEIKWQQSLKSTPLAAPAIDPDRTVYTVAGEYLAAFTMNGALRWRTSFADMGKLDGVVFDVKGKVIITSQSLPIIRAVDAANGAAAWTFSYRQAWGSPSLPAMRPDGGMFFSTYLGSHLLELNPDGTGRWVYNDRTSLLRKAPVLDLSNNIYVTNDSLGLISFSPRGDIRWQLPEVRGCYSPAFGRNQTIYVAGNRKVFAIGQQSSHISVLEKFSGDGQRGCAGSALPVPLAVLVKDQYNRPFPDQFIRFSVVSGGGSLSDTLVKSDQNGIARVFWTLGPTSLPQRVRAAGAALNQPSVNFNATASISRVIVADILDFGKVETARVKSSNLLLSTVDDCPILVYRIQVTGADANAFSPATSTLPRILKKEAPLSLGIRFTPSRFGLHMATLSIFHDQQAAPLIVQLSGEGQCTAPQIRLQSSSLQFLDTAVGDTQAMSFRISNLGCDTLVIDDIKSSTPSFHPTNSSLPFSLSPGNGRDIVVNFTPLDSVLYLDSLLISSNDPNAAIAALRLSGRGKLPWTVEPSALSFGAVCNSSKSIMQFELCNASNRELRSSAITIEGGHFQVAPNDQINLPANSCQNVTVSFRPQAMGAVSSALTIKWTSNPPLPNLVLPLLGEGIVTQLAGPDTIRFGSIPVGTSARMDGIFRNDSECDVIITSVTTFGTNSQTFTPVAIALPQTVPAGKTMSIGVTFNARHAGVALAELRLGTKDSSDTLRVMLFAKVTAPDIDVTGRFDFPVSPSCSDITAFLPVRNRGDDSLRISSIITSGNNSSDFRVAQNRFPIAVPPRDSIMLPLIFDPRGAGRRRTSLIISSNDPDITESNTTVELSGSATNGPDIQTRLNFVDFDSVVVDSSRTLPLAIFNDCSEPLDVEAFSLNRSSFSASFEHTIIAPFDSAVVLVTFNPNQTVLYSDSLVIHSNDPDENPFVVNLRGVGIAPDIDIERDDSFPTGVLERVSGDARANKVPATTTLAELNFGKTCVKDTAKYTITVHNRGESELQVYDMKTGSRHFQISFSGGFTIPPHSRVKVLMTFSPDSARTYADVLTVLSNDPDENPYYVYLRGDGIYPALVVEADSLREFGQVPLNSTAEGWVKIINRGTRCGLDIDGIYINENRQGEGLSFIVIDKGAAHLESDSSMYIWVRFAPWVEKRYEGQIVIVYNERQDTLSHPISGAGVGLRALLEVSRTRVDFGTVPVGDSSCDARTVYLRNRGTASLVVSEIGTVGPFDIDLPNLPLEIAPGDSSDPLRICYKPDNAGEQLGTLMLKTNASNKNVGLSGIGDRIPTAASICFSPEEVKFGRVALGDSSIKLVTITNCNASTVSIGPITTSGSEFRTTPDSAKLLPNGSFALAIIFTPATMGLRQGMVRFSVLSGTIKSDTTFRVSGEAFVKGQPKVTVSPNPFTPNGDGINEQTIFDFSTYDINHPTLKVFNLSGRLIRNLEFRGGSRREFVWDGLDDDGQLIPPGLFIYIIEEDGHKIESGHVVMVR